ncbi:MAG: hypothetical protein GWP27_07770 [Bacteroidetes bacterium]|nr:hypothetical protein [Bacteroidota bacterium]
MAIKECPNPWNEDERWREEKIGLADMQRGILRFYDEYSHLDWAKIPFELHSKSTLISKTIPMPMTRPSSV